MLFHSYIYMVIHVFIVELNLTIINHLSVECHDNKETNQRKQEIPEMVIYTITMKIDILSPW